MDRFEEIISRKLQEIYDEFVMNLKIGGGWLIGISIFFRLISYPHFCPVASLIR